MRPDAPSEPLARRIEHDGYDVIPRAIRSAEVARLIAALERLDSGQGPRGATLRRGAATFGQRDLLNRSPEARELAASDAVRALVEPVLGPGAFPARGLLFDKTFEANWGVPWHRDLTIAVTERVEGAAGYSAWNLKAGVVHVQPPLEVLRRMVTVRVHLDDSAEENGPLCVMPGSHRLDPAGDPFALAPWIGRDQPVECPVPAGGALIMSPLILHASHPARSPTRRRVIHLEFAAGSLPGGVRWHAHAS